MDDLKSRMKGHSKESEQQRENRLKKQNKNSLMNPYDYSKRSNICTTGTQKERRKSEAENVLKKIMTEQNHRFKKLHKPYAGSI